MSPLNWPPPSGLPNAPPPPKPPKSWAATASSSVVGRRNGSSAAVVVVVVEGESMDGEAWVGGVEVDVAVGRGVRRWRVVSEPRRSRSFAEGWAEDCSLLREDDDLVCVARS